ncbi:MAG: hypothetical protein AAEJ47_07230 [Planctomycetota bacterium]
MNHLQTVATRLPSIGLILGFVICLGLLLCTESQGDPDMVTGVSSVFPETGVLPFAHARAQVLDIEAGVADSANRPILTMLAMKTFSLFGIGVSSLKIFSVVPFLLCILLVGFLLVRRRGESVATLAAFIVALQPTFLPWASVPSTIPLAALCVLSVVLLAGRAGKYAPWKAMLLCFLLSWGISPLIAVAYPACLLEGIRRLLPRTLRPKGTVVTLLVAATLLSLQQFGADSLTLAMGITGSTDLFRGGEIPSILGLDPGWLIAVIAALIAGPRGVDTQFQPLRILLVTGILPWVLAGTLPVFPLVVLIPAGVLLVTDVLADRGRQVMSSPISLGKGPRIALLIFAMAVVGGASLATASSDGTAVRFAISLGLITAMVGIVLTIRAGLKPMIGFWMAIVATVALSMPINLHRIAHQQDRWQIYQDELDRILPPVAPVAGRWAHALVISSDRPASVEVDDHEHVIVAAQVDQPGLLLERYNLFGDRQVLLRRSGEPTGVFENACALQTSGHRSEARSNLAMLLRADPGCSAAWERFGVLLLEDGIEDLAVECLYFSIQADPGRELAHRLLASLYARRGMLREASHHIFMGGKIPPQGFPPLPSPAIRPSAADRR